MPSQVTKKLLKIIDEIDEHGHANSTRLTVLKKWFERPERLTAFAVWLGALAASQKENACGATADLFKEAQALLENVDITHPILDREAAKNLHQRLHRFQNNYQRLPYGNMVRTIRNWNLLLVESALDIYLQKSDSPYYGYALAKDYCQNYNPSYGTGLNGPSYDKLMEIIQFISSYEESEKPQQ